MNSCTLSGVPDHTLILKPGAPYIVMHNTSPALCNGTRVIYHRRVGKCLEVEIISGVRKGEFHFLPRLVLTTKDVSLPFTLKRTQFPLQSCFAMSVSLCASTCCCACAYMIHTDAGRCTRARDRHWTEWASSFPETHGRMDCSTSLFHVYAGPVIVFGSVCPVRVFSISAPSTLSKQITEAQPFLHCSL